MICQKIRKTAGLNIHGRRFMLKSTPNTLRVGSSLCDVQENSLFQWHSLAWRLLLYVAKRTSLRSNSGLTLSGVGDVR